MRPLGQLRSSFVLFFLLFTLHNAIQSCPVEKENINKNVITTLVPDWSFRYSGNYVQDSYVKYKWFCNDHRLIVSSEFDNKEQQENMILVKNKNKKEQKTYACFKASSVIFPFILVSLIRSVCLCTFFFV